MKLCVAFEMAVYARASARLTRPPHPTPLSTGEGGHSLTGLGDVNRFSRSWLGAVLVVAGLLSSCAPTKPIVVRQAPPQPPPVAQPTIPPAPANSDGAYQSITDQALRIRLWTAQRQIAVTSREAVDVTQGGVTQRWAPGMYTLKLNGGTPAPRRFHLFVKTFPSERATEAQPYVGAWHQKGQDAQVVSLGRLFRAESGAYLDNRVHYVSLMRLKTRAEAEAAKKRLETEGQWSWIEEEILAPGGGTLSVVDGAGRTVDTLAMPATLRSAAPLAVSATAVKGSYSGELEVRVGADGLLELYETLRIEDYVAGVLPAEMPASWPVEALEAQAVAARSEVLANLGVKHKLEGFNYCAVEHCRAYNGFGGRHPSSDAAVAATEGVVLAANGCVTVTVFSANCGGWSENNDNVWSSPPNPILRGGPDFPAGAHPSPGAMAPAALSRWLRQSSPAYCSGDTANFRWVRRYTAGELAALVNKTYNVGTIKEIRLGERGVSGRLKSVEIVGSKSTAKVQKELAIRQAFGALPSAMFILDTERCPGGPSAFVFQGGGRGHGVGLCQHGARGMAAQGRTYADILAHYFSGANMVRLD